MADSQNEFDRMMKSYESQLRCELQTAQGLMNFYQRRVSEITESLARMSKKETTP